MIMMNVDSNRGRTMTPAQFAKEECANLLPEGACLGVSTDSLIDNGQPKTCTPRNRCLVAEGRRCSYFEKVILPLANYPSPHGDPGLQAKRAWARQQYLASNGMARRGGKPCPMCGEAKPAGHRYCESCATKRRRTTYRLATTKRREAVNS